MKVHEVVRLPSAPKNFELADCLLSVAIALDDGEEVEVGWKWISVEGGWVTYNWKPSGIVIDRLSLLVNDDDDDLYDLDFEQLHGMTEAEFLGIE